MGASIRSMQARALYRTYRLLSPLYYHALYGRRLPPLIKSFVRRVGQWEALWRGDVPLSRECWDDQYRTGRWRFLADLPELARYSLLVGYLRRLKFGGAFLDIGCGEGLLAKHLGPDSYGYYFGVDVSAAAIAQASLLVNAQTRFVCADAESFVPDRLFDAVIFNECLYYFHDPLETFERYTRALKPGGIALMSNYSASSRAMAFVQRLKARYPLLDESSAAHDTHSWSCIVIDPALHR